MTIIVIGLPGSGKSFFASRLADLIKAEYVKSDTIRSRFDDSTYSLQNKMKVYDEMLRRTEVLLHQNKNLVVDATFYKHLVRQRFIDACEKFGDVYFIEIIADELVIKERLKTSRADSDADFEAYKKITTEWEPFMENHLVLHSADNNIEDMLSSAMAYIRAKTTEEGN